MSNKRFLLVRRPKGTPVPEDFAFVSEPIPSPAAGSITVRNHYASLDPAQRGWMDDAPSYMPPIGLGEPVRATTVGRVHASANKDFAAGDWVLGLNGIEEYSLVAPGGFTAKIDVAKVPSPSYFLSALVRSASPPTSDCWRTANLSAEKPCWSAQPRVRWAPSSVRLPRSRVAAPSASPAARGSASG